MPATLPAIHVLSSPVRARSRHVFRTSKRPGRFLSDSFHHFPRLFLLWKTGAPIFSPIYYKHYWATWKCPIAIFSILLGVRFFFLSSIFHFGIQHLFLENVNITSTYEEHMQGLRLCYRSTRRVRRTNIGVEHFTNHENHAVLEPTRIYVRTFWN